MSFVHGILLTAYARSLGIDIFSFFQIMPAEQKLIYLLIILIQISAITSIEPFSTIGAGIAASVVGSAIYAGWNKVNCHFNECCDNVWIPHNLTSKANSINASGHGMLF
jgi:hypothetical protein